MIPRLEVLEDRTVPALVAAYGFEQGSGDVLTDTSGNGLHGTVSGATWSTLGKNGGALDFDGVNDVVSIADNNLLDLTVGMTLEAWVKMDVASGIQDVLIKEGNGVDVYNLYARNWRNRPEGNVFVGGSNHSAEGNKLPVAAWRHLAATYDGSVLRHYVNGALAASANVSGSIATSDGALRIGGNSLWGEYFNGLIDDVRIYNHPLSQAEIQADMLVAVGADPLAPLVVSTSPTHSSTGVAANGNVTVQFNEALNPATVNSSTLRLRNWAGVLVPATVGYDPATQTATLDPNGSLSVISEAYVVTIQGGSSGVKDLAGNPLADYSFSFTTGSIPAMTVGQPTVDANGVQYYSVTSAYQGEQATTLRVLRPDNPTAGQPHRFLYVLPVYAGLDLNNQYGDGLEALRQLNAHNLYNATLIAPSFNFEPWYADHASDLSRWHESFMVKHLVPWVEANLATGQEKHVLVGFSKSGYGALTLTLRNPTVFDAAAAWNVPTQVTELQWGMAGNYGTRANFRSNYRIPDLLPIAAAPFQYENLLWISADGVETSGEVTFQTSMEVLHQQMTDLGVLHTFAGGDVRAHHWSSGWLPGVLDALPGEPEEPPLVTVVTPSPEATDVPLDATLTVTFSEQVVASTINFTLRPTAGGVDVSASLVYDDQTQTATLTPTAPLAFGTAYTAQVSDAEDFTGNVIQDYSWSFTTASLVGMTVQLVGVGTGGVEYYSVESDHQEEATTLRVLRPDSPAANQPHRFLYVLPVYAGFDLNNSFGDGLEELRLLDAHNLYNITIVAPSFNVEPWYADHDSDPSRRQESFMVNHLVPWVEANLGTTSGQEEHLLLGFGKSGYGALSLILRNPLVFARAAIWNSPMNLEGLDFDMAQNYGTAENFLENYRIPDLLPEAAAPFVEENRLWIGGDQAMFFGTPVYQEDMQDLGQQMEALGVLHTFSGGFERVYNWSSGWLRGAVAALSGEPDGLPLVATVTPNQGATNVSIGATVTATFSERVVAGTVDFTLRPTAGGEAVDATVVYDAGSRTAILTPATPLAFATAYTAEVSGAEDLAGNVMADYSWSFTTTPVPPIIVQGPTFDANGVEYYSAISVFQNEELSTIRVLRPVSPAAGQPHRFLYVLPVYAGNEPDTLFGEGLEALRLLDAHNQYNFTIIAPSFNVEPWYADHETGVGRWHESYLVKHLVPWAEANLTTMSGQEEHLLLGFSKSGYGALTLLLRNPLVFDAAAAWDAPAQIDFLNWFMIDNYGSLDHFRTNYRIPNILEAAAAPFEAENRIWISGDIVSYNGETTYQEDMEELHQQMIDLDILHTFAGGIDRVHSWTSGWLPDALAFLAGASAEPLHLLGEPIDAGGAQAVTTAEVSSLFEEAVRRWQTMWPQADAERLLQGVRLEVADLPGTTLGLASGSVVKIDFDAAGYGWFVDATPWEDSEFDPNASNSPAAGRVDLLTVLTHELGHVLGLADDYASDLYFGSVMGWALPVGIRRISFASSQLDATQAVPVVVGAGLDQSVQVESMSAPAAEPVPAPTPQADRPQFSRPTDLVAVSLALLSAEAPFATDPFGSDEAPRKDQSTGLVGQPGSLRADLPHDYSGLDRGPALLARRTNGLVVEEIDRVFRELGRLDEDLGLDE